MGISSLGSSFDTVPLAGTRPTAAAARPVDEAPPATPAAPAIAAAAAPPLSPQRPAAPVLGAALAAQEHAGTPPETRAAAAQYARGRADA
ncbi:hypothetical protein [Prosthecomicrobium sp. N25]|uniref:hypothetical protein n=1 Tax=Prosthecomicrobium sp. N25 TaxID=3129254 RepID=UPI0030779077